VNPPQPRPQVRSTRGGLVWDLANIRGQMVPQRTYDPRSRRGEHVLEPPIFFKVGDEEGITVRVALDKRYSGLKNRDELMFVNRASSISLRFEVRRFSHVPSFHPDGFAAPSGQATRPFLARYYFVVARLPAHSRLVLSDKNQGLEGSE
jgi:hypothetical protein